jgi:hypothetical protein
MSLWRLPPHASAHAPMRPNCALSSPERLRSLSTVWGRLRTPVRYVRAATPAALPCGNVAASVLWPCSAILPQPGRRAGSRAGTCGGVRVRASGAATKKRPGVPVPSRGIAPTRTAAGERADAGASRGRPRLSLLLLALDPLTAAEWVVIAGSVGVRAGAERGAAVVDAHGAVAGAAGPLQGQVSAHIARRGVCRDIEDLRASRTTLSFPVPWTVRASACWSDETAP